MSAYPPRFDEQAACYDQRAGIDAGAGRAVAAAVVAIADVGPTDVLLEAGAGTGEIGRHLAALPMHYVGLDLSREMLAVFRDKLVGAGAPGAALIQADCERPWPVCDGVAEAVFASRVVHLLDAQRLVRELVRVCRPGGYLLTGWVLPDEDGAHARLRRQRHVLLDRRAIPPPAGAWGARRFVAHCLDAGAEFLGRRVVAQWTGTRSAANVIAGWEKSTMPNVSVDADARAAIFEALRQWAQAEFGGLDRPVPFTDRYQIEIVRWP